MTDSAASKVALAAHTLAMAILWSFGLGFVFAMGWLACMFANGLI